MGTGDGSHSMSPAGKAAASCSFGSWKCPTSPFSPPYTTDKKVVFLFEWWLVEAERAFEGKRLAVSGYSMRQYSARLFCSAPIIKRNDAYTVEAADGITVIFQGMINKTRTQDNGFPLEVCNYFLIGFPYNWDQYVEEYFNKQSTSNIPRELSSLDEASKDSSDNTYFPVHPNDFPLSKVLNFMASTRDKSATSFSDFLQNIFNSTSVKSKTQKYLSLSSDCLSKFDVEKNDGKITSGDSVKGKTVLTFGNSPDCDIIGSFMATTCPEESIETVHADGQIKICSAPSSNEINNMYDNISKKILNCSMSSIGNPTAQICLSGDIRFARDSEVTMCTQNEHSVEFAEKQGSKKHHNEKQNHDSTECIGKKVNMCVSVSATKEPLAVEDVGGEVKSTVTKNLLSIEKGPSNSSISGIRTRSGRVFHSFTSSSRYLKNKSISSCKREHRRASKEYEVVVIDMLDTTKQPLSNLNFQEKGLSYTSKESVSTCNLAHENATAKESEKQNGLSIDDIVMKTNHSENFSLKSPTKGKTKSDHPVPTTYSEDKSIELFGQKLMTKSTNQNVRRPDVSLEEGSNINQGRKRRKGLRKTPYIYHPPITRGMAKNISIPSPESLNLRRSRSGRLIVPPLDNGCLQIVYNKDGSIAGITNVDQLGSPCRGSKPGPAKRRIGK